MAKERYDTRQAAIQRALHELKAAGIDAQVKYMYGPDAFFLTLPGCSSVDVGLVVPDKQPEREDE